MMVSLQTTPTTDRIDVKQAFFNTGFNFAMGLDYYALQYFIEHTAEESGAWMRGLRFYWNMIQLLIRLS